VLQQTHAVDVLPWDVLGVSKIPSVYQKTTPHLDVLSFPILSFVQMLHKLAKDIELVKNVPSTPTVHFVMMEVEVVSLLQLAAQELKFKILKFVDPFVVLLWDALMVAITAPLLVLVVLVIANGVWTITSVNCRVFLVQILFLVMLVIALEMIVVICFRDYDK